MRERAAEGLLDQIAEQSLDDDYYMVRTEAPRPSERILTAVALACFALMVTIAAVQTRVDRPATEREQQALAQDVRGKRELQADRSSQLTQLKSQVADLTAQADRTDPALQALLARTAGIDVRGPGVVIDLVPAADDGGIGDVSDEDLRRLANALWMFGAEAVAVNRQRLASVSSIRIAGEAVTVNYVSIKPPYRIEAIGDAEQLAQRLKDSRLGREWTVRAARTGTDLQIDTDSDLRLKAIDPARLRVSHARPVEVKQ